MGDGVIVQILCRDVLSHETFGAFRAFRAFRALEARIGTTLGFLDASVRNASL